jgi:hypothetical protein
MILDSQAEFSDAQAVTSTAISTNVLDLFSVLAGAGASISPNARIDIGDDDAPYIVVQTQTAATDTSSDATLTVTVESADDAGLTTNAIVHHSTGALAFATFSPQGAQLVKLRLPRHAAGYRRYLGVRYTVASGPLTAGNFDAFLTPNVDAQRPTYKSGFTVQ